METDTMNTDPSPATITAPARRGFLKKLAALGGAAAFAPALALAGHADPCRSKIPSWLARRVSLQASGVSTFDYVVPLLWPPFLGFTKAVAEAGGIPFWVTYMFPVFGRDLMSMEVKMPSPTTPGALDVVSLAYVHVEEITVGPPVPNTELAAGYSPPSETMEEGIPEPQGPMPTFSLMGRIVSSKKDSPFGTVVGRTMTLSASFDREGKTTYFYLLGGAAAGSHASFVRKAKGSLRFHGFGY